MHSVSLLWLSGAPIGEFPRQFRISSPGILGFEQRARGNWTTWLTGRLSPRDSVVYALASAPNADPFAEEAFLDAAVAGVVVEVDAFLWEGLSKARARLLLFSDEGGSALGAYYAGVPPTGEWERVELPFEAPRGASSLNLQLFKTKIDGGATVHREDESLSVDSILGHLSETAECDGRGQLEVVEAAPPAEGGLFSLAPGELVVVEAEWIGDDGPDADASGESGSDADITDDDEGDEGPGVARGGCECWIAMTYPKRPHGIIAINLGRRIAEALDARPPCHAVSEAGILSPTRSDTYYHADLAVTCQPYRADRPETPEPILIVEVLSPSTEDHDRKLKLADCRKIPSVMEILFVDQERPYCELHRRLDDDRWLVDLILDLEARIELESLGADLPVAWIYANVTFADPERPEPS